MARRARIAATVAVTGALISAAGLSASGGPAGAAPNGGPAEIVSPSGEGPLRSGGSRTAFRIKLPSGAACQGDSAKASYRIQSYLVPQSVDLDSLTFDSSGPVAAAGQFRAPMYEADFSANSFVNRLTAEAVPVGGPGPIVQPLPAFSFAVFDPAFGFPLTPGTYNVGIACTVGPPSAGQQEKHWNTVLTITPDPADDPARISWTVSTPPLPAAASSTSVRRFLPAAGLGLLLVGSVVAVRRHRGREDPVVRPPSTLKETQ